MAGQGYKLFNTGDVLTAAQVNTYLQEQVVMVFADATARTTALASVLAEGMFTYLKDTDVLQYYSGASWVTVNTDQTPLTTKGDLFTFSTADARLAVGSNNQTLLADSAQTTGLKWAPSPTSVLTTTGDTLYASAANTLARLGIGSTGDVLTVAGGVPSWAAPAGGSITYSTWTPTLTQLTQGNGTVTARYAQSGKFVTGSFKLSFGSTTTITAGGGIAFSLPVTAKATYVCTATVTFLRTGVGYESGMAAQDTTTQIFIGALKTSTNYGEYAELSSTVPHTWGNGDFISVNFVYEAA